MPDLTADQALQRALQYHRAQRVVEAEAIYRQILVAHPEHVDALHLFGLLNSQTGRHDVAANLIGRAVRVAPHLPELHMSLGNALADLGRHDQAVAEFLRAVELKPDYSEAFNNLGNSLKDLGRNSQALAAFDRAIELNPGLAAAHNGRGILLAADGKTKTAIECYRTAIQHDPNFSDAYNNLGIALHDLNRIDEAIASYHYALNLNPKAIGAHMNLGISLVARHEYPAAVASYERALQLEPASGDLHVNLALALLATGQFEGGWREYEWRWRAKSFLSPRRNLSMPQWTGQPLAGKTLFLHCEQGLGDTIQFIRYAPLIAERGAKLIVECQPELIRLIKSVAGITKLIAAGPEWQSGSAKIAASSAPAGPIDFHCPMMSLPAAFGTRVESVPGRTPYLTIESRWVEDWQSRLGGAVSRKRVGLIWAGHPGHKNDRNRSLDLRQFGPLASVTSLEFHSLQKGVAAMQVVQPPAGLRVADHSSELYDFAETAALMSCLQLVITADTAAAHLAGALGKPTWLLLPYNADFRWMVDRETSPWYPTMRLFRQSEPGDWSPVICRISDALTLFAK